MYMSGEEPRYFTKYEHMPYVYFCIIEKSYRYPLPFLSYVTMLTKHTLIVLLNKNVASY